ncbi:MAG: hypothetical protein AB1633_01085 [Elusimicrobiota bacterium]
MNSQKIKTENRKKNNLPELNYLISIFSISVFSISVFLISNLCLYAAFFDSINTGARQFALAGSYLAISDDAYATNPAGLGQISAHQVGASHNSIYDVSDLGDNLFSGVIHYGRGSVQVGLRRFGILGEYSEDTYLIGYGREVTDDFWAGFNYKVLGVSAPGYSKTGDNLYKGGSFSISFDIGLLIHFYNNFKFAFVLNNINSPEFKMLSSSPESEKLNMDAGAGLTYSIMENMLFSLEYWKISGDFKVGSEISISDAFFLRLGTNKNNFTGGIGTKFYVYKGMSAQIDFGFSSHRILGFSHQVSTIFRWQ